MSGFIQEFQFYMSYPFVRYALIVGVLISLCSSLLGLTLVLKRFSFIGDGLSHVAFGALAIATVLKIANVNIFIMPVTIVCAILLLRTGTNTKLKGDAAIAILSVGSMAVGYLILNVFSVSSNVSGDVCSTLFGSTSILTLTGSEVVMCVIASLVVVAFFIIFYNRIFSVTFDENFTRSMGKNNSSYNSSNNRACNEPRRLTAYNSPLSISGLVSDESNDKLQISYNILSNPFSIWGSIWNNNINIYLNSSRFDNRNDIYSHFHN